MAMLARLGLDPVHVFQTWTEEQLRLLIDGLSEASNGNPG